MEKKILYSIPARERKDYYLISTISIIFSLIFFYAALFGKSIWTRMLGVVIFMLLFLVGILTYKLTRRLWDFEIIKDGIRFFSEKEGSEKIIKKQQIKKLTFFHVIVDVSDLKIKDEYYVLSIDTEKNNYRYLPTEFFVTKKKPVDIKPIIKALNEMGGKVEVKEIIIDKTPENRHEFDPEYPERYGNIVVKIKDKSH